VRAVREHSYRRTGPASYGLMRQRRLPSVRAVGAVCWWNSNVEVAPPAARALNMRPMAPFSACPSARTQLDVVLRPTSKPAQRRPKYTSH